MDPFTPATELAAALRRRQLSPVELLDACLAQVDRLNPSLNAVVWRNDEQARREASLLAEDLAAGRDDLPPFAGVPIPDQGPHAGRRVAGHLRLLRRTGGAERRGRTGGGGPATGRLRPHRSHQHARVRAHTGHREPALRHHPEPLGSGPHPGRVERRRGGSRRLRHVPAGPCQRRGRIHSHPGGLLGPGGPQTQPRPGAGCGAGLDGRVGRRAWSPVRSPTPPRCSTEICGPDPLSWYNAPPPDRPFALEVGADPGRLRVGPARPGAARTAGGPAAVAGVHRAGSVLAALGHHVEERRLRAVPGRGAGVVPAGHARRLRRLRGPRSRPPGAAQPRLL